MITDLARTLVSEWVEAISAPDGEMRTESLISLGESAIELLDRAVYFLDRSQLANRLGFAPTEEELADTRARMERAEDVAISVIQRNRS